MQQLQLAIEETEDEERMQGTPATMPEQIHIAYGDSPSEMIITWSSYARASGDSPSDGGEEWMMMPHLSGDSMVWYRKEDEGERQEKKEMAIDVHFALQNPQGAQWIHRARLKVS